eukprot:g73517.t1
MFYDAQGVYIVASMLLRWASVLSCLQVHRTAQMPECTAQPVFCILHLFSLRDFLPTVVTFRTCRPISYGLKELVRVAFMV